MTPAQALDFLAGAAQHSLTISRLNDYNSAVEAIRKLIEDAAAKQAIEASKEQP